MMQVKIRTLTPIWTGDVERKSTKLRETSILGSLRWWFEVIVRGLGGYACNPVSGNRCPRGDKGTEDLPIEKKICPACYLFGTTGWSRRFRVEINQSFREAYVGNLVIKGVEKGNWYYPSGLVNCNGNANILEKIFPLKRNNSDPREYDLDSILKVLFVFISNWGTVGGKTAIGYGVVRLEDKENVPIRVNEREVENFFELKDRSSYRINDLKAPKLSEMFFVKFRFKKSDIGKIIEKVAENVSVKNSKEQFPEFVFKKCSDVKEEVRDAKKFLSKLKDCYYFIPVSALIRKELRRRLRENYIHQNNSQDLLKNLSPKELKELRHFLMGKLGRFSTINVSHVYLDGGQWELRIWGWIPEKISEHIKTNNLEITREEVIEFLKKLFYSSEFWKDVFGVDCIEKPDGANYIVEYPENNWNFIDLGKVKDIRGDIRGAFKDMLHVVMENEKV